MTELSVNGTSYKLSGPEGAPVVVLVHGLGLNSHVWQSYEPVLSERYRVLSYDLFGHGKSVSPPGNPSLSLFSEQLRDLLDELNIDDCAIVGFSLGGMINRRFSLDYPSRTRALVILNSPHERSPEAQKLVEERAAKTADGGPAATLNSTIERWFTPEFRDGNPEYIRTVCEWVMSNDPVIYTQCRQVLARGVVELVRPHPPITQPTLVITSENDSGSTPSMAYAIADEIPGSKKIIVPHLQHMGLVEEPSIFACYVLGFLNDALK